MERGRRAPLLAGAITLITPDEERRLETQVVIVGRAPECHVQILDPLVSRRHLRLTVTAAAAVAEDLRSANGVYINGERIHRSRPLCDGDRILIGTVELSVFAIDHKLLQQTKPSIQPKVELARISSGSMSAVREPLRDEMDAEVRRRTESNSTARASAFEVLGRLADRMFAVGRGSEAERVLGDHLIRVIEGARAGLPIPDEIRSSASRYALKLGAALERASWVDYVVELHVLTGARLSGPLLEGVVNTVPLSELDAELCRDYLAVVARGDRDPDSERSRTSISDAEQRLIDRFLAFFELGRI